MLEAKLFLREWLDSPKLIGSIAPSSSTLAAAMVESLSWQPGDLVLELGAGTGAISAAIVNAGVPDASLIMVELSANLCRYLRQRFPNALVINADARQLARVLGNHGVTGVKSIVSSLPLLNMPLDFRRSVMEQAAKLLLPGGHLVQYSYSPLPPSWMRGLGIEMRLSRLVLWNLPPAVVWQMRRSAAMDNAPDRGATFSGVEKTPLLHG